MIVPDGFLMMFLGCRIHMCKVSICLVLQTLEPNTHFTNCPNKGHPQAEKVIRAAAKASPFFLVAGHAAIAKGTASSGSTMASMRLKLYPLV